MRNIKTILKMNPHNTPPLLAEGHPITYPEAAAGYEAWLEFSRSLVDQIGQQRAQIEDLQRELYHPDLFKEWMALSMGLMQQVGHQRAQIQHLRSELSRDRSTHLLQLAALHQLTFNPSTTAV